MRTRKTSAVALILIALLLGALGVALAIRPAAPGARLVPPVPREAGEVLPLAPGAGQIADEGGDLEALAAYWHERLTYPTGQFDPAWRLAAVAQDAQMARGVPTGRVIYDRTASR